MGKLIQERVVQQANSENQAYVNLHSTHILYVYIIL